MTSTMDVDAYQRRIAETYLYPEGISLLVTALELNEEAGEVAGKVKRIYRDQDGRISPEAVRAIVLECGDVLWNLATLLRLVGVPMTECMALNISKVEDRAARGVVRGQGDNR